MYFTFMTYHVDWLWLIGVSSFAAGFYIAEPVVPVFKKFRMIVPLIIFVVLVEWIFYNSAITTAIYNSGYGSFFLATTTWLTIHVLNAVSIHASQSGDVIILSGASKVPSVSVVAACSGVESSLLFLAATGLIAVDMGRKVPKKKFAAAFCLGAVCIYLITMLRVPLVISVGYFYGLGLMEAFHDYAGMLIFLTAISVYWWLSLRWFSKDSVQTASTTGTSPR
jgi:exosortase/archaeosortase family protein